MLYNSGDIKKYVIFYSVFNKTYITILINFEVPFVHNLLINHKTSRQLNSEVSIKHNLISIFFLFF